MKAGPYLTVVVMAYNEVASFDETCDEIMGVLNAQQAPWELVVVDDGSSDGTEALAEDLAARDQRVRVIHHAPNRGLGGVYRTGFTEARGDFVTFFPADGQFPATIIADFLPRMQLHDMVLGFLSERDSSAISKLLSAGERLMYRMLFGYVPRFQGIVMFKRTLLDRVTLHSDGRGWAILMEFLLRCAREEIRLVSVPTPIRPRAHGTSKVNNLRTIWSNFRQMLALRGVLS